MKKIVVFTDLDGTLLDAQTYSYREALPALRLLREIQVPLIICSSKTRKEIERCRERLENSDPFISENGGGIFIPAGYFGPGCSDTVYQAEFQDGYEIVRLGTAYPELRRALATLKERGLKLRGFGDMPAEEVAEITGLNIAEARLAKEREFDEPFLFEGDEAELVRGIASLGFSWTKGRFFHILGDSDKGRAVSILVAAYRRTFGEVFSVGIGDNINDLPMLREVEYPILVQRPDGSYTPGIDVPKLVHAAGPGPSGWNKEVLRLLNVCV